MPLSSTTAAYTLIGMAEKFQEFFYNSPQDVTFKYKDINGTIQTKTVPNVSKVKSTLEASAVTDAELSTALANYYTSSGVDGLVTALRNEKNTDIATAKGQAIVDSKSYTDSKLGLMTKADFEANASRNREIFAGSGFVDRGRHHNGFAVPNAPGMWIYTYNNNKNKLRFGDDNASDYISDRGSMTPIVNINGSLFNIVGTTALNSRQSYIFFSEPNLPTIESDSSILSKDYKQGDNILLTDTSRELVSNTSTTYTDNNIMLSIKDHLITANNNELTIKSNGSDYFQFSDIIINGIIPGIEYEISVNVVSNPDNIGWGYHDGTRYLPGFKFSSKHGTGLITCKAIINGIFIHLYTNIPNGNTTSELIISSVSIKQVPNQKLVVTSDLTAGTDLYDNISKVMGTDSFSRQDMGFLESDETHNVTATDRVYVYGNRQYMGGNVSGVSASLHDNDINDDSKFGDWSDNIIGRHYLWSELSLSDKQVLASDPENNIRLDKDVVLQTTYVIRTEKGLGNNWSYDFTSDKARLGLVKNIINNGKAVSSLPNSLLITIVQRKNVGIYDPVFNNEGCAKVYDGGSAKFWHESTLINSVEDCFKPTLIATVNKNDISNASNLASLTDGTDNPDVYKMTGLIASTVSGRPDSIFADEVNERDVEDLRMDAHKVTDYKGYLEEKFNDAVVGKIRGKEKDIFLKPGLNGVDIFNAFNNGNRTYKTNGTLNDTVLVYRD